MMCDCVECVVNTLQTPPYQSCLLVCFPEMNIRPIVDIIQERLRAAGRPVLTNLSEIPRSYHVIVQSCPEVINNIGLIAHYINPANNGAVCLVVCSWKHMGDPALLQHARHFSRVCFQHPPASPPGSSALGTPEHVRTWAGGHPELEALIRAKTRNEPDMPIDRLLQYDDIRKMVLSLLRPLDLEEINVLSKVARGEPEAARLSSDEDFEQAIAEWLAHLGLLIKEGGSRYHTFSPLVSTLFREPDPPRERLSTEKALKWFPLLIPVLLGLTALLLVHINPYLLVAALVSMSLVSHLQQRSEPNWAEANPLHLVVFGAIKELWFQVTDPLKPRGSLLWMNFIVSSMVLAYTLWRLTDNGQVILKELTEYSKRTSLSRIQIDVIVFASAVFLALIAFVLIVWSIYRGTDLILSRVGLRIKNLSRSRRVRGMAPAAIRHKPSGANAQARRTWGPKAHDCRPEPGT